MTNARSASSSWTAVLAWGLLLLIAGAAIATWGLARWDGAARFLGVDPAPLPAERRAAPVPAVRLAVAQQAPAGDVEQRIAALEKRLRDAESIASGAAGSAGRADALVVAFASRRAIDRGVALGYLEPLLAQRFGASNPHAVAAIVNASRAPVTLAKLTAQFQALEPTLRRGPPEEKLWDGLRRELGSLIAIHRASSPPPMAEARFERALAALNRGEADAALAETMRLPGAARAGAWIADARRYVLAHRALDEIESAALMVPAR